MVVVSKLSTAAILLTWTGFTPLKGNTKYVHIYADTNLISGAKIMNILSQELKMITWCSWVYDLLVEDQDKADHAMKDTSDMVEKLSCV